ncbi:MAG: NDP-sugar synthase [Candidatus Saganbacteria bacterium]|nr:NDP-sugar synthase [Candidatus Saganbacteria bacterium]
MMFKRKKDVTHALIMAAGYGTRMEPLTLAVPKPMVYIANKPAMLHNIELARKHGIKNAVCNIHYFPEQIENFFYDGEDFGVSFSYSYEEELLGTAGGVRRMGREIENLDNTFIVMSSDALTDINLQKLIAYHKSKKALATVALAPVPDPSDFGVVILDEKDNRITAFQEKPKKEDALSNLVNAGIYVFEPKILDMIPAGRFYDFGKELFPKLVEDKARFFGYQMKEFWSDVGGLKAYLKANQDVLSGHVRVQVPGKKIGKSTWIGKKAKISSSARFSGGVVIGERAVIEDGVELENVVVGDRTVISKNSKIKNSVLWSDSIILSSVAIDQSVVGSWCYIGKEVQIISSVVANRCRLGPKISMPSGTTMNPGTDLL